MTTMTTFCSDCKAVGETCCSAARQRQETVNTLARLVHKQSQEIICLTWERNEARLRVKELSKGAA